MGLEFTIVYNSLLVLVVQLCPILCDSMNYTPPVSSVHEEFSRQEYWSGYPFPAPGDLSNPGIDSMSPSLQTPGKPCKLKSLQTEAKLKQVENPKEESTERSLFGTSSNSQRFHLAPICWFMDPPGKSLRINMVLKKWKSKIKMLVREAKQSEEN